MIDGDANGSLVTGHVSGLMWKLNFVGQDLQEIEQAFHRSVDEYLRMILADYAQSIEISDESDIAPQETNDVVVSIHLPDEIIQQIQVFRREKTIPEFIVALVTEGLKSRKLSEEIWQTFEEWNATLKIISVIPMEPYSLRVKFEDGLEGEFDMKPTIQNGDEFSALASFDYFQKAAIGENGNSIIWSDEIRMRATEIYETIMADLDKAHYG